MTSIVVKTVNKEISIKDPEEAYKAIRAENTYLLESREGINRTARYSFIGYNPAAKITVKDGKLHYSAYEKNLKKLEISGTKPLSALKNLMKQLDYRTESNIRFFGGLVGYLSYDHIRYGLALKGETKDDLGLPDAEYVIAGTNIVFDHLEGKTCLLSHHFLEQKEKLDEEKALNILKNAESSLMHSINENNNSIKTETVKSVSGEPSSNIKMEEFISSVEKAKEYIRAGDIFQVVLSQRLMVPYTGDAFAVYEKLQEVNPSPYMYYLDFGDKKIIGSSPEMLVKVENRRVETYPIAGTRPRGKTHAEDLLLEKEMLSDEKEKAEHVMLVDLGRNDLGKVSNYGTVKVDRYMDVEKYSHVMHMVSSVSGTLQQEYDEFDALEAVFPAGTVSGAPKVRAMEIIDELEPTRRGIYAGAVGYFSFNHNMDYAIAIRTVILKKDKAYIQAGAGIVSDSKPEAEFQETLNKAHGLIKTLKEAQQ